MKSPRISFVVIGLDEAATLGRALEALGRQGFERGDYETLYVDSGSLDGSPEIARAAGVDRLLRIPRRGASAARARNEGLGHASAPYVQFVDGDTCLEPGWTLTALDALESDPSLVGVEGNLREARPDASIYNAVCELDWRVAPGHVDFVGGNGFYRREPLVEVEGFDPAMRVGEDPELGARLRERGWKLLHLDVPMGSHDLDMTSLAQYLRRAYTNGVCCALVVRSTGGLLRGYWHRRLWKTLLQATAFVAPLLLALILAPFAPAPALLLALACLAMSLLLITRKALSLLQAGHSHGRSVAFALHTYAGKLPMAVGMVAGLLARPGRNGRRGSAPA